MFIIQLCDVQLTSILIQNGRTALMNASEEGHASVVTLLINYKADVNLVDHVCRTNIVLQGINVVCVLRLSLVLITILRRPSRLNLHRTRRCIT